MQAHKVPNIPRTLARSLFIQIVMAQSRFSTNAIRDFLSLAPFSDSADSVLFGTVSLAQSPQYRYTMSCVLFYEFCV